MESLLQGQVFCQELRPMEYPHWKNLFLKDCTLWKGSFLEKFLQKYIPWEGPALENFMKYCVWWSRDQCEAEGAAEVKCYDLKSKPFSIPPKWQRVCKCITQDNAAFKILHFFNEQIFPSRMKAGAPVICTSRSPPSYLSLCVYCCQGLSLCFHESLPTLFYGTLCMVPLYVVLVYNLHYVCVTEVSKFHGLLCYTSQNAQITWLH